MVRQKAISLKVDIDTLNALDQEVSLGYKKRNTIINDAIRMYLDAKDTKRRWLCCSERYDKATEYEQFEMRWFPHI